jgi:general stress protein 26
MERQEAVEKLRDLVKGIDFTMMTTIGSDGKLHSRPMSTQDLEFDGELWFFADKTSEKAHEITANPRVNLSYADTGKHRYVSVTGTASLSYDRAKMEKFWNPALKVWFPDGLETPTIALIRVAVEKAEYWESDGRIATLLSFAKSLVTGKEANMGENEELDLQYHADVSRNN